MLECMGLIHSSTGLICDPDPDHTNMVDDFLIAAVNTQFLYKTQDDALWIMNLYKNNITYNFILVCNFTSHDLWRLTSLLFLSQHGNYLYVSRLDAVSLNYQITKISKPSLDGEVDFININGQWLPKSSLTSFIFRFLRLTEAPLHLSLLRNLCLC